MGTVNDDALVERLTPKILSAIRSKSKPVESLSVKADLTGVTSLPGYDTTGGQYKKVLVAIDALRQPALDAASGVIEATDRANAAADNALAAAEETRKVTDELSGLHDVVSESESERVVAEQGRVDAESERVDEFARLAEESAAATASANDTADHPTYIGQDNYVYRWNKEMQTYDKTDVYVRGEAFSIKKVYGSIDEMMADTQTEFKEGDFCLIDVGDVENPDNAKLYVRNTVGSWDFLVDMSGAIGFTGKTPQILVGEVSVGSGKDSVGVTLSPDGVDTDGNPKYRYNFIIPCLAYEDLTSEQIAELQKPATDVLEQMIATRDELNENEDARKAAEQGRVDAENLREEAEDVRKKNETARISGEDGRVANELLRTQAEDTRVESETIRISNEEARIINEQERINAEILREEAESKRESAYNDAVQMNKDLLENQPRINEQGNWEVWSAADKEYVDTKATALGKSPIIREGIWWIWDDDTDDYVSTGESSCGYILTKEEIEDVFTGDVSSHTHSHLVYCAQMYDEEPDFEALTTWTGTDGMIHEFVPGNDIYVKNESEPTGYANYKLAVTTEGNMWVRIPQVAAGWRIVMVKE